ncbi:MAG: hypothetical protein NTV01_18295 [Bacteroidia bacterium]|nr:hypothetical protein [Bacteroidia bacterium]
MDINCFAEDIDNKALLPKGFQRSDIVQPIWYRSTMLHDLPEKFLLGKGGGEEIMNGFDSDSNLSGHLQQIEADRLHTPPVSHGMVQDLNLLSDHPEQLVCQATEHESEEVGTEPMTAQPVGKTHVLDLLDPHPLAGGFHLGIKILRTRPGVGLVRERTHEGFERLVELCILLFYLLKQWVDRRLEQGL